MIIHAYGLFWRKDEINWEPGAGNKDRFRLLGRLGKNLPRLRLSDFRQQRGVYILYGNYGPHYVGLTRRQNLGKRLKDHLYDDHMDMWDRFSWFGFRRVLKGKDKFGLCKLRIEAESPVVNVHKVIGDIEALLIRALAVKNVANMNFAAAQKWEQVKLDETERFYQR